MRLQAAIAIAVLAMCMSIPTVAANDAHVAATYTRMSRIASQLDCPVCQGQSVKDSHAQLAQQMRATITEKIAEGISDDQILDFFTARYGERILRDPPKHGLALGVWIGPVVAVAAGLAIVALVLLRRRPRTAPSQTTMVDNLHAQIDELRRARGDGNP